jgi:hypothetical protein
MYNNFIILLLIKKILKINKNNKSFPQLICCLSNKSNLKFTNILLNQILKKQCSKKETKTFLTIFISLNFKENLNIGNNSLGQLIYDLSADIYLKLQDFQKSNNFSRNLLCNKLSKLIIDYIATYKEWKILDKNYLLQDCLYTYIELKEFQNNNIENKNENIGNENLENKENDLSEDLSRNKLLEKNINGELLSIINNAKILDKDWNKEFFEREYSKYLEEKKKSIEDLELAIKNNMTKAFWDNLYDELNKSKPNFLIVMPLLSDLKSMLMNCVPNRQDIHAEFNEYMDIEFIESMVKNEALDNEYIYKMIVYIISNIKKFESKSEDKDTEIWEKYILKILNENQLNYGKLFVEFFKKSFKKVEKILYDSQKFMELLNKSN